MSTKAKNHAGKRPAKLLSGGNPQIPKGDGDGPVQDWIAAAPDWKQAICARLDELIEQTVPNVTKAVKWYSPFYVGPGNGWFLAMHVHSRYVKVTFFFGRELKPMPPVDSTDPHARYYHVLEKPGIDERQFMDWVRQAAAIPGWDPGMKAGLKRSDPNPQVDWFFAKQGPWRESFLLLRELALASGLKEELKWGHPCYTLNGKNVFLIHGFKDHCALLFHKGALLKDPKSLLVQQTENVQSARQLRFTSVKDIERSTPVVRAYMKEAIALEGAGRQVALKKTADFDMPEELEAYLKEDAELRKAFKALTPGRQRGYLLHIGGAKKPETRVARIEKCRKLILAGKGWNER